MSARQPRLFDSIARKWLALAERRVAHVMELRDSGRWRHYYTLEALYDALREAVDTRDEWARIAGLEQDEAMEGRDRWSMIAGLEEGEEAA